MGTWPKGKDDWTGKGKQPDDWSLDDATDEEVRREVKRGNYAARDEAQKRGIDEDD